jgi:hypothetical protein
MYILQTQTKSVTCYMTPVLSSGRTPHDKTATVLITTSGAQRQDGLTDCQLQSNCDFAIQ